MVHVFQEMRHRYPLQPRHASFQRPYELTYHACGKLWTRHTYSSVFGGRGHPLVEIELDYLSLINASRFIYGPADVVSY